ncbi:MAG TPA: hypothetical protein VF286_08405, partial [Acidiphilium sp.]
ETRVLVLAARLGAADPAYRAMNPQPHGLGKIAANGALLGFQGGVIESIFHRISPQNPFMAPHRNQVTVAHSGISGR